MKDSTKVGGRGWMMMDEVGRGLAQPRAADFEALAVYSQRKTNQNRLEPLLADGPTNPKCRENRRNRSKPGKHLYARPRS